MTNTETNTAPKTFTFSFRGIDLRAFLLDGAAWFIAADALDLLGISRKASTSGALAKLRADEKQASDAPFPGMRGRKPWIINKKGLFRLDGVARFPQAQPRTASPRMSATCSTC